MSLLEEPMKEVLSIRNYVGGDWVESEGELVDVVKEETAKPKYSRYSNPLANFILRGSQGQHKGWDFE